MPKKKFTNNLHKAVYGFTHWTR